MVWQVIRSMLPTPVRPGIPAMLQAYLPRDTTGADVSGFVESDGDDAVAVFVNGERIGDEIVPDESFDVSGHLKPGWNELTVHAPRRQYVTVGIEGSVERENDAE